MQNPSRRAKLEDERFRWTPKEYIERYNLDFYLEDALKIIQTSGEENPAQFLAQYFSSILSGRNILFREFSYIHATPLNRWSFCLQLRKTTSVIDSPLPEKDWAQWIKLICPDFPDDFVRRLFAAIATDPAAIVDGRVSPAVFGRYFEVMFFYDDFLRQVDTVLGGDPAPPTAIDKLASIILSACAGPKTPAPSSAIIQQALGKTTCSEGAIPSVAEFLVALTATSCLK